MPHSLYQFTVFISHISLFPTPDVMRHSYWPCLGGGLKRLGNNGLDHEDRSNQLLRHIGDCLPIHTVSNSRTLDF